jgi:hypothetical protein
VLGVSNKVSYTGRHEEDTRTNCAEWKNYELGKLLRSSRLIEDANCEGGTCMYGIDKIGSFDKVSCSCGWTGQRLELKSIPRYDGYDEQGESVWVEDYFGCPICLNEDVK